MDELLARCHTLLAATPPGGRVVLGIAGAPGAGKSSFAAGLVERLGDHAVHVPMDGFHLANRELARLGRVDRKGAADTFDPAGFAALLRRCRTEPGPVYAPDFDRDLEEPVAGAIRVEHARLVVTEGNYLLLDTDGWAPIRALLDQAWYLELPASVRHERLVRRHVAFGRPPEQAKRWVDEVDEVNAELVAATRDRADLVVTEPT